MCPLTKGIFFWVVWDGSKSPCGLFWLQRAFSFPGTDSKCGKMKRKPTVLWCLWVTWSQAEGQQRESRAETPHDFTSLRFTSATNWRIREVGKNKKKTHTKSQKKSKLTHILTNTPPGLLTFLAAAHYVSPLNKCWWIFMSPSHMMS